MPSILIETRSGWITEPAAVTSAVHEAVAEALKLPAGDKTVRLVEHAPTHFPPPPGKGRRHTLIQVNMFAGRSLDAKRALYRGVVANLGALGVPAGDVTITLIEAPVENWGVHGGQMAADIDLGFKIDV